MTARRWLRRFALAFIVALMVAPLYLLLTNAFKTQHDIVSNPFGWPADGFSFDNIVRVLFHSDYSIVGAYALTISLAIMVNILSMLITGPAAYAIARGERTLHRTVMLLLLTGLFIPGQAIVIPVIYVLKAIGLMGTVPGLVLFQTALTIPITLFLYVAYVRTIPRELDEAAKLDGASRIGTFWRVIFPLMRPAIVTAAVLNSVGVWGDFVNPRIILGAGSDLYTVTTGVYSSISKFTTDLPLVYAHMLLASVPIIVFYILLQKRIIGGLISGAIKG
jgi:raffinose/stachyose/melibiose transport system permease protein